jgi:hypothetical protein
MDVREIGALGSDIGSHWYYRSKAAALTRYLGQHKPDRILDVGARSGFFTKHLLQSTPATEGCRLQRPYPGADCVNTAPL